VLFNVVLGIWITAGIIIGFMMPPAVGLVHSTVMYFHVPMAVSMLTAFLIAAWRGIQWLRTRDPRHDAASLAYAEVGAFFGIIATMTGSIWAGANWQSYWNWDAQQIGIVGTLLTYGALFALRSAVEDDDKKRDLWAVYAIFGVIAAIFLTYVFRRLVPSLHPNDTLTKSAPGYRLTLWFNVFGYIMLLVRVAGLRARFETARERLKELSWAMS
jgi:heme exporter protein C